jgi:hypothetical protein
MLPYLVAAWISLGVAVVCTVIVGILVTLKERRERK